MMKTIPVLCLIVALVLLGVATVLSPALRDRLVLVAAMAIALALLLP
jgi:hypothetical protein